MKLPDEFIWCLKGLDTKIRSELNPELSERMDNQDFENFMYQLTMMVVETDEGDVLYEGFRTKDDLYLIDRYDGIEELEDDELNKYRFQQLAVLENRVSQLQRNSIADYMEHLMTKVHKHFGDTVNEEFNF